MASATRTLCSRRSSCERSGGCMVSASATCGSRDGSASRRAACRRSATDRRGGIDERALSLLRSSPGHDGHLAEVLLALPIWVPAGRDRSHPERSVLPLPEGQGVSTLAEPTRSRPRAHKRSQRPWRRCPKRLHRGIQQPNSWGVPLARSGSSKCPWWVAYDPASPGGLLFAFARGVLGRVCVTSFGWISTGVSSSFHSSTLMSS